MGASRWKFLSYFFEKVRRDRVMDAMAEVFAIFLLSKSGEGFCYFYGNVNVFITSVSYVDNIQFFIYNILTSRVRGV